MKRNKGNVTAQMIRYRNKYPHKVKAQNHLNNAIKYGKMVRGEYCQICGIKTNTHAHHSDYSYFFDVIWVCWQCHIKIHKGE